MRRRSSLFLSAPLSFAAFAAGACADHGASYSGNPNDRDAGNVTVCASCGPCEESKVITSANHVDNGPIDYPDPPPMGGDHRSCWATWGVHTDVVPVANWVHNLEHGGVIFAYNCRDGCPDGQDALAQIRTFVSGKPFALYTEYPDLPSKFAVVSWGHRLVSDCIDVEAAIAFYTLHFNRAPESIAANPSCN